MSSQDGPEIWSLRSAAQDDCRMFWEWANDPAVRAMSFHTDPIPWEEHQRWFAGRLAAATSRLYVLGSSLGHSAGQIRFDERDPGVLEVDVTVAPRWRGGGLGRMLLAEGERALLRDFQVPRVLVAHIKTENHASLALFRGARFQLVRELQDVGATHAYVLQKQL